MVSFREGKRERGSQKRRERSGWRDKEMIVYKEKGEREWECKMDSDNVKREEERDCVSEEGWCDMER